MSLLGTLLAAAVSAAVAGEIQPVAPAVDFEVLHAFEAPPPRAPYSAVVVHGNGRYYGTLHASAPTTGQAGHGAIYVYDPATDTAAVLHMFSGPDGSLPY